MTNQIKASLLCYFRFKRNMDVVATEVNSLCGTIADVMCYSDVDLIEIEVKTSVSDLKNELRGKKIKKHNIIKQENYFYSKKRTNITKYLFCVPEEMKEFTVDFAKKLNPKYGILIYKPFNMYNAEIDDYNLVYAHENNIKSARPAKKLTDCNGGHLGKHITLMRASSDLCIANKLLYEKG